MSFVWPAAWLLILPLAAFLYWHPFRSRWVTGLRLALYLALVLALSGIVVEWPDRTGTLIVAVDRSRSMPDDAKEEAESFLRRLEASRPRDSRLGVVAFGAEPVIDQAAGVPRLRRPRKPDCESGRIGCVGGACACAAPDSG